MWCLRVKRGNKFAWETFFYPRHCVTCVLTLEQYDSWLQASLALSSKDIAIKTVKSVIKLWLFGVFLDHFEKTQAYLFIHTRICPLKTNVLSNCMILIRLSAKIASKLEFSTKPIQVIRETLGLISNSFVVRGFPYLLNGWGWSILGRGLQRADPLTFLATQNLT